MSTNTDNRPSLAELREHGVTKATLEILLDIAEASRSMFETASYGGTNYDIEFEGDKIETLERLLKQVAP